ncbi:MAG: D-alanyl-D-alanine carboxypeptidase [Pseudomonadales bacterium]|nr:D-alanyl-D-alanine carboxypeptidase [Pseudomonadales bacterium]
MKLNMMLKQCKLWGRGRRLLAISMLILLNFPLNAAVPIIPSPPQLAANGYLLIDADTGKVIVEHNSQQRLPPASLTKMMTSYVASSVVGLGTLNLDEEVIVSEKAWRMEGSRMFIRVDTKVTVRELLRGIIIQSGNDASVALAEHIAGGEDAFADVMNQQAQHLGMTSTHFMNATGLPDEEHYTTAADLARLTQALIHDFPEHYQLYREKYYTYNDIKQPNRNQLLWRDKTVDGVKTGHTDAAGYCLVASAVRDGMRLISVVMGAGSEAARATESQKLLSYGFRYYETRRLYEADKVLKNVRIWGADESSIGIGLGEDIVITVARGDIANLVANISVDGIVKAPLEDQQVLGQLKVLNGEKLVIAAPLVALHAVEEAGFFSRLWDSILLFFRQLLSQDPLQI